MSVHAPPFAYLLICQDWKVLRRFVELTPRKRTSRTWLDMSALCHSRLNASQQSACLHRTAGARTPGYRARSIQATECFIRLEKRTPGAAEVGSCLTDATRGGGSRRTVREQPLR